MRKLPLLILLLALLLACGKQTSTMNLAGQWSFALDPNDQGSQQAWYSRPLNDTIHLPGSLQEQGYGLDVDLNTLWTGQVVDSSWFKANEYAAYRQAGNMKVPFWLQPNKHYVGVAWYQREVEIPADWDGQLVELNLERVHWQSTIYWDTLPIATNNALQVPHRCIFTASKGKHTLTARVDNRLNLPVGINAHSVSDHTQTNWNGMVGELTLTRKPSCHIVDIQVYPNVKARKAEVRIKLNKKSDANTRLKLEIASENTGKSQHRIEIENTLGSDSVLVMEIDMGNDMLTWSEFAPNLYQLIATLKSPSGTDARTLTFGMRNIEVDGTRFMVNGIPIFLRGTLECAIFPLTGYASVDPAYWEKIFRRCKEFGLNHVRFHSWCPPHVAFDQADKAGVYLQVECGGWTTVGNGGDMDKWFYDESERILKEYGNHPSFCLMAYGNEPGGNQQVKYLSDLVQHWKDTDSRRMYTSAAGWPYIPNADYYNSPDPRIQRWGEGLNSVINARPGNTAFDFESIIKNTTMPTVSHEIGQWCVYPNLKERSKYTGLLKANNFDIFEDRLRENHLLHLADSFLYASGRLQTLCYKADIEAALRTPGFAGFQLLDLHDFPGQGTALVGVLDPFWDPKGYVTGAEYSQFCNRTVPLARMEKLLWRNNERFKASIEVAHFGKGALKQAAVQWTLTLKGENIAQGSTSIDLPVANNIAAGNIEFDLATIQQPAQLLLTVHIDQADASNTWNIWVYPAQQKESNKPFVTNKLKAALAEAASGGTVLYCIPKGGLRPDRGGDIKVGFSSIFWNTAWTQKQAPHVLGVYCIAQHPALALFPNEGHSDYQWWDVVTRSSAMDLRDFPSDFRPIVHLIDDWFTARKLGILFEAKLGKGKIMVCSTDLENDLEQRPAALQFRRSIEQYMVSDQFKPSTEVTAEMISRLVN